jgi:leucyl-tRNA synthetase
MEPNFTEIEQKWQKYWQENHVYKTNIDTTKPKFYVLDMFPYPSGAGLHVGHPLGYIASDIVSRYKRLKGFNVLHPMGFDAFGLPAEQYAIQTGRHPADTTAENIARYKEQLNNIGFCYDWSREVNTSEPDYYKWTQWIFLQLFDSWYNENAQKAEPIATLIAHFEKSGTAGISSKLEEIENFTAQQWNEFSVEKQRTVLMQFRLAYQAYSTVNWCEGLGTVLANDEVKDGFSERGGFPVEKRQMRQWFLRITAYAERLLNDLNTLEWSDSMKEMQRNWIGKSEGASIRFQLENHSEFIEVFTTRPDTIFGVDFLTLAPEHELVAKITTAECKDKVESYINTAKNRSERERIADVKRISGEFTGAYVIHPFSGSKIPVWIGDYVLAGYGTGAVMAVPAGDQRDWDFAKHFNLPITPINKDIDISEAANPTKEAQMINSDFLNGLTGYEAMKKAIAAIEEKGLGKGKVNFRLRDAGFSRQRYWGEPFPIIYKSDQPYAISETELPLHLPVMEDFKPTGKPESPLVKALDWVNTPEGKRETDTMPGYAGSSWYFLRYMDPQNDGTFVGKEAESYWQDVDLYIGGTEHAVGHLLYARFWQKFLFDRGHVSKIEPFKKLVNQGMIQGVSAIMKIKRTPSGLLIIPVLDNFSELIEPSYEINFPINFLENISKDGKQYYQLNQKSFNKSFSILSNLETLFWPSKESIIKIIDKEIDEQSTFINLHLLTSIKSENLVNHPFISVYILRRDYSINIDPSGNSYSILFDQPLSIFCYEVNGKNYIIPPFHNVIIEELRSLNLLIEFKLKESFFKTVSFENIESFSKEIGFDFNLPSLEVWNTFIDDLSKKIIINEAKDFEKALKNYKKEEVDVLRNIKTYTELIFLKRNLENGIMEFNTETILINAEVEKMSKSKYNVVNPDDIIKEYGADTLRLYEMFLGPLEQSKPWNTNGIEGVYRFLNKLWRLFYNDNGTLKVNDAPASEKALRILHKTLKKIEEDVEKFSFNTSVSSFMICVNELNDEKCSNKAALRDLLIAIAPFSPHIAEELWAAIGEKETIFKATFPQFNEAFIKESSIAYPVAFNGKVRYQLNVAADMPHAEVQTLALQHADAEKWLEGASPKKVIVVPGRMVNVVI